MALVEELEPKGDGLLVDLVAREMPRPLHVPAHDVGPRRDGEGVPEHHGDVLDEVTAPDGVHALVGEGPGELEEVGHVGHLLVHRGYVHALEAFDARGAARKV